MSIQNEINQAISAHGQWKNKLRDAIETGQCESTPDKVKMDNNCSFGKWLHYKIGPDEKKSAHYNTVVKMHADFHKEAGSILELALNGNKEEAQQRIGFGSKFAALSASLTSEMKRWKDSLG